jgi:hypothetical protein
MGKKDLVWILKGKNKMAPKPFENWVCQEIG